MFSIGEFSHIARVTPRQLRHYEELGLFKPEHIDPETYLLCGYVLPFLTLGLQQVLAKILPARARFIHPNRWNDVPRACQHLQLYLPTRTTS